MIEVVAVLVWNHFIRKKRGELWVHNKSLK